MNVERMRRQLARTGLAENCAAWNRWLASATPEERRDAALWIERFRRWAEAQ